MNYDRIMAFLGTGMPAFPVPHGTPLDPGGATTDPVAYSITRYGRIPIVPIAVSVPLCLPLAGRARAFAHRLDLLHEVLRYCDMRDLV